MSAESLSVSHDLLRGTLRTIILKLLHERTRMYGYEITQTVRSLTKGRIHITEGALYPMLHKLEREGLLLVSEQVIGARRRRYYQLNPAGKQEAIKRESDWFEFVSAMEQIMRPEARPKTD
jgi:DNA-binding PadR family transcriptional regulator